MISAELIETRLSQQFIPSEQTGNYEFHYSALLEWFQCVGRNWTPNKVMLGCLAVYGWMPRILEVRKAPERCLSNRAAENVAFRLNSGVIDIDPPFVNESVVGTSKFLHFWNPQEFPIWDSRVRRTLLRDAPLGDPIEEYNSYRAAMKQAATRLQRDLRDIEYHLFQVGLV
ncbi:MAG: hypothetical protein K2P68_04850 [Sphingomonas sp.]|nr:hypothetical protein [Sphingomonas sp.]